MPARRRLAVYAIMGALWLSGCVWLVLDEFFESRGPFGVTRHPWQGAILTLHGIVAIISTYLFGWLTAGHVLARWPRRSRRLSGATLAAFLMLLTLSGFALFFVSDDRWQRLAAVTHDALGLGILVFAIQHWFFARRRDMRSADSRPW
jgi:phosphoglycerol transferase MdoB-like AlkP superfamily enzyme